MLQALNILENFDLKSMGYNSARYIHTIYQAMNLAFADRDFIMEILTSRRLNLSRIALKRIREERAKMIRQDKNDQKPDLVIPIHSRAKQIIYKIPATAGICVQ
jgi:gamma-glutamyltranspeptidase/glutathione hydrolase